MKTQVHFAPIAALDLDPIKVKLMHKESGEGWSLAYADAIEFEYRRFLYLVKKYPDEQAAPLYDVDVFWHYHILDTLKYAADCEAVFGYFLHHFPYVGLRGEEDLEFHHVAGERMRELYQQTYGESHTPGVESERVSGGVATAYSMPAQKKTLSHMTGQVAYSQPFAQIAYSQPFAKVAYSQPFAKIAYSQPFSSAAAAAAPHAADDSADVRASAHRAAARFSHVRPTLPRAAA